MRSFTATILFCTFAVWIAAGDAFAQTANTDGSQVVQLQPFYESDIINLIHYGNCQWLYPLDEPNEPLLSEPEYRSAKHVYYAARYGDAKDNLFTLVLDEDRGADTGFNVVYADTNNDNRIDPQQERFGFLLGTTSGAEPVRITLSVSAGGKTIPYTFGFTAFPYKDSSNPVEKIHANCRNSSIMMGEAVFAGRPCKVALADLDSNGLFNNYEQGLFRGDRFFVDLNGDGNFGESGESLSYAQYARIGDAWYTIEASPDGGAVRIQPSTPTFGAIKAPAGVKSVGLSSPKQYQDVAFAEGRAQAITGVYEVRSAILEIVDDSGQRWITRGSYGQTRPKLVVDPNREAALGDILPLTIQVAILPGSDPDTVQLEPRITDSHGGTFSTLRRGNSRHEPPAYLVIKDAEGKQVAKADLGYG
jgi:hypothetical protein